MHATREVSSYGRAFRGWRKMRVYEHSDADSLKPRSHPWIDAESNPAYRYYDFKTQPALIRSSLEDLQQWEAYPAIETFYRLLE
jgi:hypothetical protein